MANKNTTASEEATLSNEVTQEEVTPQTEDNQEATGEETQEPKAYFVNTDLKFTDKETRETKFTVNLKYSMPIEKISAAGAKRTEYLIFIDGIFFGRTSKYYGQTMYLKTKSQKEFQFKNGAELKDFLIKRAAEFGSEKNGLDEELYSALIQTYGLTEEDLTNPIEKPSYKAATLQQQVMFI